MNRENVTRVRYAVVGLGWFGQAAVLPAFQNATDNSELAAVVSDDEEKREELSKQYGVPAGSYDDFEAILEKEQIDAAFLVVPNSRHHEFTLRAANCGVHVLCEKPLAGSAAEAKEMIEACRSAGVRLMTAYRLHFEKANLSVVELLKADGIGELRLFSAIHTNNVEEGNTRLEGDLAGGPLQDLGVYCINAARYLFQAEPLEVVAMTASRSDPRFDEVPEMVSALLRFPEDRLAAISCGFGESSVSRYQMIGTKGDVQLDPAFSFDAEMTRIITREGKSDRTEFPRGDQIAPEILYFSDCILNDRNPEPSGLEGLIDLEIIEAIEESMRSGRPVKLSLPERKHRPEAAQRIDRPPIEQPELVAAEPPR